MRNPERYTYTGPDYRDARLSLQERTRALFASMFAEHVECVVEWEDKDWLYLVAPQALCHSANDRREFTLNWHVNGSQLITAQRPRLSMDDAPPYLEITLDGGHGMSVRPNLFIHGSLEPWLPENGNSARNTDHIV